MRLGDWIRRLPFVHTWAGVNVRLLRLGPLSLIYRRGLAPAPGGLLRYRCNLCEEPCESPIAELQREHLTCLNCGSSVRMRALIHLLSQELFDRSLPLTEFPDRKDLVGLGLSDAEIYAGRLAARLDYTNTFYHREPRLDITDLPDRLAGLHDFVIASEVFEHVPPPVSRAFESAFRLLKPGGLLLFSVPWSDAERTLEHFPDLYEFELAEEGNQTILRNRTREGRQQVFRRLEFHGGPGQTLEMRVFAKGDLIRSLEAAGFRHIRFHEGHVFDYGIYWPQPQGAPLVARRPA